MDYTTPGKEYTVYELSLVDGEAVSYSIVDDAGKLYPVGYPSALFEQSDGRFSKAWKRFDHPRSNSGEVVYSFVDWSSDGEPWFYDRLLDGGVREREVFRDAKAYMDTEFDDPKLPSAEHLEGSWYQCPKCGEAWETRTMGELDECPNGHTLNTRVQEQESC